MSKGPRLEFQMRIAVEFETPYSIAGCPLWDRRILHVTTGTFEGPAVRGKVLAGGGDWVLGRRDGSAELDIRFTLKTFEDEIVYYRATGLFVASGEVAARIRSGENVSPDDYYFRTSVLFEAGSSRLNRLNHTLHVGVGQRTSTGMITEVFAVL